MTTREKRSHTKRPREARGTKGSQGKNQ